MSIELRGIIQFYNEGTKHVQIVVKDEAEVKPVVHEVGIDIEVNRGRIITFLSAMYGIPPGEIVWPAHIEAINAGTEMSLAL